MRIKSITDIITNSSSEVYAIIDSTGINNVRSLLQEIMSLFGDFRNVDEVFNFKSNLGNSCSYYYEYENPGKDWNDLSDSEKEDFAEKADEELGYDHNWGGPFVGASLTITTNDTRYTGLVERLNGIENYFKHIEIGG